MIIAKGQGNYESLSDMKKSILFVLIAKCPVIAREIGCDVGSIILKTYLLYSVNPVILSNFSFLVPVRPG